MKKVIFNTKRMIMILMTVISLGLAEASFAGETKANTAELTFAGNKQDRPVFQLKLNNTEDGEYLISIKDADGAVLYTESLKGKDISKSFWLNIDEQDINNLQFVITSKKTNKNLVYKITNTTRLVRDLNIAKL